MSTLTAELTATATDEGKSWGEEEVENWKDQHDGIFASAPEWTMGTWCGTCPDGLSDEEKEAYEGAVDQAAARVWNDARLTTFSRSF